MTEEEIIQLKLSSGEEVLCEIIQWDDQHNATILVKNAFEIVFLQSPTGAMRLCTLRPFMIGQIEEGREMVMPGDNVTVTVKLIVPVAINKSLRFAIREGGRTVGAGQITEIL